MALDLLLIHPPVTRPTEPPLGVASLAGFLRSQGFQVGVLDLNVEVLDHLLTPDGETDEVADSFSRRALKKLPESLRQVRSPEVLRHPARYRSAVRHLERVLWLRSGRVGAPQVTFTDFRHPRLSPLCQRDLHAMASSRDAGPLQRFMEGRIGAWVGEQRPRWVGISVNYLSQILPAMGVAGSLREMFPRVPIVWGGSLVTNWLQHTAPPLDLGRWSDHSVAGPGEIPLARLLGSGPIRDPEVLVPDFSGFPWPLYFSPQRIVPLATTRGCYWGKCRFCPEAGGDRPIPMIPDGALKGVMRRAAEEHGARWVHFMDNAIPPRTLRALAAQGDIGVRWFGFARFEPSLRNRRLVRELRRSGCRMLQLGLESGSQHQLDRLEKGIRIEEASRILRTLHEEGIGTYVYIMFGIPGEVEEEARQTLDFVVQHAPWIDHLNCAILNVPRRTRDTEGLETFPFPGEGEDLSLYTDFRSLGGLDRKGARRFLTRKFRRHPAVAEILRRELPTFTSSHAALFLDGASSQD